jgi:hypothetical protein
MSTPDKGTLNERIIHFTGGATVNKDLALGEEVEVLVHGGVVEVKERDNQDGTKDRIFVVKQITSEIQK